MVFNLSLILFSEIYCTSLHLVITVYFSNLSSMPTTCQNIQFLGPFRYSRPIEGLQDRAYFFYYYHFPCHKIKNYLDITLKDKAHFIGNYNMLPHCIYLSVSNLPWHVNLFSVKVISLFSLPYTDKSDLLLLLFFYFSIFL